VTQVLDAKAKTEEGESARREWAVSESQSGNSDIWIFDKCERQLNSIEGRRFLSGAANPSPRVFKRGPCKRSARSVSCW